MRKLWILPLAAVIIGLVVACGGGKKNDTAQSSGGGTSGTATLDLQSSTAKLDELRSFRFSLTMKMDFGDSLTSGSEDEDDFGAAFGAAIMALLSDIKADGAVVAPDKSDINISIAGEKMRVITIGQKVWTNEKGKWKESTSDSPLDLFGDSPIDLAKGFLPAEVLKGAKVSKEKVNGVDTTRYSFDKKALQALAEELGEGTGDDLSEIDKANLDVWVNGDEIPVKIALKFEGKDESGSKISIALELNITDINANIDIKAPI